MLHVHSCDGQYALCYNYEKIHHRHYIIIAYDERGGGSMFTENLVCIGSNAVTIDYIYMCTQ